MPETKALSLLIFRGIEYSFSFRLDKKTGSILTISPLLLNILIIPFEIEVLEGNLKVKLVLSETGLG